MAHTIVLVRHGRSAHVHVGFVDLAGFRRWREAYDAAGIADEPPPGLRALAAASGIIVASETRRAVESAKLLADDVHASALLRELELAPPNIRIRMPLMAWALAFGLRWIAGTYATPAEVQRSREAAAWLGELAERHGSVLAVTHGTFRSVLAQRLREQGWRCEHRTSRSRHWSAWTFVQ